MARHWWRVGNVCLVATMVAACALPTVKTTGKTGLTSETVVRGAKASIRPKAPSAAPSSLPALTASSAPLPAASKAPAIVPSVAPALGGSLIGDNGAGVIANNSAALSGVVRVPSGLIANNSGSLIGDNGAGYRIAAAPEVVAAPQVEVGLVDAKDQLLAGTTWVKTDAQGRYAFEKAPTTGVFYVRARVASGGKTHQFASIAKLAGATGTVVDVTPATTLVAEKTRLVGDEQEQATDAFSPDKAKALAAAAEAKLAADKLPDFSQGTTAISAALDKLLQADDALETQARALDRNVGTPVVRAKQTQAVASGVLSPEHVAFDAQGNLFVVGLNDHTVYKRAAGATALQAFASVQFPHGVACDPAGNVYVSRRIDRHSPQGDILGQQVYKISPDGKTVTPLSYTFASPTGLAVSADGKTLYVAQNPQSGGGVVAYDLVANTGQVLATGLTNPIGVALDSKGTLYVTHIRYDATAKSWLGCLSTVTPTGTVSLFYGGNKDVTGADSLEGLTFDAADNLYVSNNWGDTIFKFTPKKKKIETFLKFNQPTGLAFDPQGNLVVANYALGTLSLVTP